MKRVALSPVLALAAMMAMAPGASQPLDRLTSAPKPKTRRQEKDEEALRKAEAKRERKAAKRLTSNT